MHFDHRFEVIPDEEDGYTIVFPDLPGCVTVADIEDEIIPMATDAYWLWLENARYHGIPVPPGEVSE